MEHIIAWLDRQFWNQTFEGDEIDIDEIREVLHEDNDKLICMPQTIKIRACQTPEFREETTAATSYLVERAHDAFRSDVDVLLFPEGYLQGYFTDAETVSRIAISVESSEFRQVLKPLENIPITVVFGFLEIREGALYNSAAIVRGGAIITVYRKNHLLVGEACFAPGDGYPVFTVGNFTIGINICFDMQFSDAAMSVRYAGAQVVLCPANNMMRRVNAEIWKDKHHELRIERARETGLWIVSADVTGEREGRVAYGPTSVINPLGEVVKQVPLTTSGFVDIEIPWVNLLAEK